MCHVPDSRSWLILGDSLPSCRRQSKKQPTEPVDLTTRWIDGKGVKGAVRSPETPEEAERVQVGLCTLQATNAWPRLHVRPAPRSATRKSHRASDGWGGMPPAQQCCAEMCRPRDKCALGRWKLIPN